MSATDYMRGVRFDCHDCGHDTRLMGELYMVNERLWDEEMSGTGVHMICIGCLEARIGRRLGHEDFINCPLNYEDLSRHSLRLRHRLCTTNRVPSSALAEAASGPGGDRPTPTGQVTPNHNGDEQ